MTLLIMMNGKGDSDSDSDGDSDGIEARNSTTIKLYTLTYIHNTRLLNYWEK